MTRILTLAAACLATAAVAAFVPSTGEAQAATSATTTTTALLTTTLRASNPSYSNVLRLPAMTLRAGQARFIDGRIAATSNVTRGPMIGARIICLGGGGGSTYSTTNHGGKAAGTGLVVVRWLFVAPQDSTYTCELRGIAHDQLDPDHAALTLVRSSTVMTSRPTNPASAQWGDEANSCVGIKAIQNILQCSTARSTQAVLRRTISTSTAKTATVLADVELSREYGAYPGGDSAVQLTLRATPVDTSGRACASTKQLSTTPTISGNLHHYKPRLTLSNLPVNQSATCGKRLTVDVYVKWVKGNPVTMHNRVYSNAIVLLP
ncbi:hypothetical protein [Flindersiella endophytica]